MVVGIVQARNDDAGPASFRGCVDEAPLAGVDADVGGQRRGGPRLSVSKKRRSPRWRGYATPLPSWKRASTPRGTAIPVVSWKTRYTRPEQSSPSRDVAAVLVRHAEVGERGPDGRSGDGDSRLQALLPGHRVLRRKGQGMAEPGGPGPQRPSGASGNPLFLPRHVVCLEAQELAAGDSFPYGAHKCVQPGEVVAGGKHRGLDLPCLEEVAQVRAGVVPAGLAAALLVDGSKVVPVLLVAQRERAVRAEDLGVARRARRERRSRRGRSPPPPPPGCTAGVPMPMRYFGFSAGRSAAEEWRKSRNTGNSSPTERPPMAYPGRSSSAISGALCVRRSLKKLPCMMPKSSPVRGPRRSRHLHRSSRATPWCAAWPASRLSGPMPGAVHSSRGIITSLPSVVWMSTTSSGVSRVQGPVDVGAEGHPSSSTVRKEAREKTW